MCVCIHMLYGYLYIHMCIVQLFYASICCSILYDICKYSILLIKSLFQLTDAFPHLTDALKVTHDLEIKTHIGPSGSGKSLTS